MKTYGTKRILPVYGDSRPIERRINNVKIAGWKEQSFNATLVSQNDTYNDSAFLKIYGKSEQVQTTQGKNLFDAYNYVTSYPDDIKPVNQDGEDWIKMQSSTKQARYNFNAKENTQYTFTFEFKRYDDSGSYSANFVLYYTDGTSETLDFGYYGDGILHKVSKTSAQNKTISYIRNANNGNTVYFLLRVNGSQIEEGITATAYSPFVPNSPSPYYPSPINSVTNFDLVSTGKNLFGNFNSFSEFKNLSTFVKATFGSETYYTTGLTFSNNTIKITGTGARVSLRFGKLKPNTTYTFSCDSTPFVGRIYGFFGTKSFYYTSFPTGRYIFNFTTDATGNNGSTSDKNLLVIQGGYITIPEGGITLSNFQLEESSTATTYEPFIGMQTINFPYTLRSLPDGTKDYIEIDNVNKTAKLYRNIGQIILNGTEKWVSRNDITYTGHAVYRNNDYSSANIYPVITNGVGLSNNFSVLTSQQETNNIRLINTNTYGTQITIEKNIASTAATLKTWLSTHNTEVQYKLATPTITDLDYEEVITYYPYTQIYTNAEIQPTLEGSLKIIDRGGSL